MTLHVTLVTTPAQLAIAKAMRYQVFVEEQGFAADVEHDDQDLLPTTRHVLARDVERNTYVATARCLLKPELRKGKVCRIAVVKEGRGKRVGVALMAGLEALLAHECDTFTLASLADKRGFYEKCGYACFDGELDVEPGVDAVMMVTTLQQQ